MMATITRWWEEELLWPKIGRARLLSGWLVRAEEKGSPEEVRHLAHMIGAEEDTVLWRSFLMVGGLTIIPFGLGTPPSQKKEPPCTLTPVTLPQPRTN